MVVQPIKKCVCCYTFIQKEFGDAWFEYLCRSCALLKNVSFSAKWNLLPTHAGVPYSFLFERRPKVNERVCLYVSLWSGLSVFNVHSYCLHNKFGYHFSTENNYTGAASPLFHCEQERPESMNEITARGASLSREPRYRKSWFGGECGLGTS